MSKTKILGRAWFYNTGDPPDIEVWEHELEPITSGQRSGADWAREHLNECYDEAGLRELLEVPATGSFQVIFKGEMEGFMCNSPLDPEEWDEQFSLEEREFDMIPANYLEVRFTA